MNAAVYSRVAFSALTENSDDSTSLPIDSNGRTQALVSIDLSEVPTAGTAEVAIQYQNAAGVWRTIHTETIDNTLSAVDGIDPILIDPLLAKKIRIALQGYAGLVATATPVEVTASVEMY